MTDVSDAGLFPAEHRGLRELHAFGRGLVRHWRRLADRMSGEAASALRAGGDEVEALLGELEPRASEHGVEGVPAAQGVGANIAGLRRASDLFLERNQALRMALGESQHVVTLLDWLGALAQRRNDADWSDWHAAWSERVGAAHQRLRGVLLEREAADPDGAIEPADSSPLGRAGHKAAVGVGTLGEAIDASALGRAARRLRAEG